MATPPQLGCLGCDPGVPSCGRAAWEEILRAKALSGFLAAGHDGGAPRRRSLAGGVMSELQPYYTGFWVKTPSSS